MLCFVAVIMTNWHELSHIFSAALFNRVFVIVRFPTQCLRSFHWMLTGLPPPLPPFRWRIWFLNIPSQCSQGEIKLHGCTLTEATWKKILFTPQTPLKVWYYGTLCVVSFLIMCICVWILLLCADSINICLFTSTILPPSGTMTSSMLRRQLKNLVQNYSEAEVKVKETNREPGGPWYPHCVDLMFPPPANTSTRWHSNTLWTDTYKLNTLLCMAHLYSMSLRKSGPTKGLT